MSDQKIVIHLEQSKMRFLMCAISMYKHFVYQNSYYQILVQNILSQSDCKIHASAISLRSKDH